MKMDDTSKQHSFGSGAQRNPHPRPFFYVQPPSQPYYLYQQWLNNPYNHYGLPGGFNIGRPCMHPYPFVPYPGFVLPHAPIYPMDYRRMFEPRFHAPSWGDMSRQQHHSQPYGRRETACSEAQTDPSEAIAKLIECLDKIRATELQGADRELDSGVASQSSSVFSPKEETNEKQGHSLPSALQDSCLKSPAMTLGDSTAVLYDSEPSQVIIDPLSPKGCWTGGLEEELPIDSSSVHEECPKLEQSTSDQHLVPLEKVTDIQSNISVTDSSVSRCDAEESTQTLSFPSSQTALQEAKSSDKVSKTGRVCDDTTADGSCHILKLPFDNILTPGASEADRLSSPAAPYYYNYLPMQTTHERMSVLSPSLDELSSRDEMFSTDLDDADIFPKHVYTGRRLAEVINRSPQATENVEEAWLPDSKRFVCACCGKNLAKGISRSKSSSSKIYQDEAGDSEEGIYGRGCEEPVRVVVRKHSTPRKAHPLPQRHTTKQWYKRGQYKEPSEPVEKEEDLVCEQDAAEVETGLGLDLDSRELQCMTCQDKFCREDLTTADQGRWADGDAMPRRRQAAALKRQEMSSQWKLMYHRPREEDHDDDDEPPALHWERDMAAATSTLQHSYGLGPQCPNPTVGAEPPRGPHQAAPAPPGLARPEGQHQKPFFYIQSSQPCLPLQWPVPMPMPMHVSYNPYYGYPGLGYGLPVMPHYQPNPYVDPPGFVVPHTQLHLMDYRRVLNPQYYQTMAYHARRFRYQHQSAAREMTSSEVQTEPLSAAHKTSILHPNECYSDNTSNISTTQILSPALAKQEESPPPELQDMTLSSTTNTPSKSSFVIQTEEVRIECCTTPVGLQLLHSHETAEMSHSFSKDMVQCGSNLQSNVLQDKQLHLSAGHSKQALQVSPDIVFDGMPTTGKVPLLLGDIKNQTIPVEPPSSLRSQEAACDKAEEIGVDKDLSMTSKNFQLQVINLPFDPKFLDELRKIESTVWSTEEALPPSTELLIQNSSMKTHKEALTTLAEATAPEILLREEVPTKEVIPGTEMLSLAENELEDVPIVESLGDEMASGAPYPASGDIHMSEMLHTAEVTLAPKVMGLNNSPIKTNKNQHRIQTDAQEQQDTSFESLPAYLPSTSWFSDFDHFYYCKFPPAPKKQRKPLSNHGLDAPNRRRKLDLNYKELPNSHKPKERYKPKGKVDRHSLSDHECCLSRSFNENLLSSYVSKKERLCSRCLAKRRICPSPSPGCNGKSLKRKAVPLQQWNDTLLPTCDECKSRNKRQLMTKSSIPDLCDAKHGHDAEGEYFRSTSCHTGPKRRAADDIRKFTDPQKLVASKQNVSKCPVALYPKLREKNCVRSELQHQPVATERLHHCPHGNTIREMDENCAMPVSFQDKQRIIDHMCLKQRWHNGKSLKDMMPNTDHDGFKNEARPQHLNKHKNSLPQLQGTFTEDSQC